MAMAMATTINPPTSAQTTASLSDLETLITDIKNLLVELSPARSIELASNIRSTKQSVHSLLLTSNFSLKDKIAYEQQKRALARQKRVLADMGMRREIWADVLKKTREEKKQLRRLERIQLEYEDFCSSSQASVAAGGGAEAAQADRSNNEQYKADLENKMIIAMGRTVRAGKTYGAMLAKLDADVKKIKEDTEWYRKQAELDEKALERAKVARKAKTLKSERMRCENLRMEGQWKEVGVVDEDEDEWLPEQYKAKTKANAK